MKKLLRLWVSLLLLLSLLLTGCTRADIEPFLDDLLHNVEQELATSFGEMEYTRPDPEAIEQQIADTVTLAQKQGDVQALMEQVYACYDLYYSYQTNYALANIFYCNDMTDSTWEEEYNYCLEHSAAVDAAMDQMLYDLAACPVREQLEDDEFFGQGFFDAYDGSSIWDETFTELMDQEAALISRYYDLNAQAVDCPVYSEEYFTTWGSQMEDLFVELVALRQQIADYAGYDSYVDFAYDFYFYRDYTPQQAMAFMEDIQQELTDLYISLPASVWNASYKGCSQSQSLGYVEDFANAMGGTVADAFQLMKNCQLYNNTVSSNKYDASFEVYLQNYYVPYIFLCPNGTAGDKLTFAHEFGHFCSDYAAGGSMAGIDVAEVFSQAMEYLSLCYSKNVDDLRRLKLADSLCTFVEQSAYASFEHQVYSLEEDALTAENIRALYRQIGEGYGFTSWAWDSRDYVMISHFFTNPMYIISYVVSNDAAMQIYEAELADEGAGLSLLENNLATEQAYFLAFLEEAELSSPFVPGRVQTLYNTFLDGIW